MIELIPNWHPVWVHFAIALLVTGAIGHTIALTRKPLDGATLQALIVGRWTLWIGVLAAGLALLTGTWAAGSVTHDDVSHANMMVHRNWAFAGTALFLVAAVFEWLRRVKVQASVVTVALSLAGTAAIGVTAYEGGQNVYEYGLGVQRLPEISNHDHSAPGHAHGGSAESDVGEAAEHDDSSDHHSGESAEHQHAEASAPAAIDTGGHEHTDSSGHDSDAHDHDAQPAADEAQGHDHEGHDHGDAAASSGLSVDSGSLAEVAAGLSAALVAGDPTIVAQLVDADVLIFESGNVESSRAEYEGHHMPADMAFLAAVDRELISRQVIELADDGAVVSSRSRLFGHYKDRDVDLVSTETLVLKKENGQWRIVHIHWSSDG